MVRTVRFKVAALQPREAFEAHVDPILRIWVQKSGIVVRSRRNVPRRDLIRCCCFKGSCAQKTLPQCLVLARLVADLVEAVCRNEGGLVHPLVMESLKIEDYDSVYKKLIIYR
jgi:hypothetical protein